MVYFDEHQIAFVHIPRTGGGSIETATGAFENSKRGYGVVNKVALQHLTLEKLHEQFPKTQKYLTYAVIRDPVERFLSEYFWCEAPGLGHKGGQSIDQFIASTAEIVKKKKFGATVYHDHFIPQVNFLIKDGKIGIDHLYLFTELNQCIADLRVKLGINSEKIPHYHKSNKPKPKLSPQQTAKIRQIYAGDQAFYQHVQKARKSIFIMTSVVQPLVPQKGIYDRATRLQQCLDTVKSVRSYCPGAPIAWFEGVTLTPEEENQVKRVADYYFNFGNSYKSTRLLRFNKTIGECYLLMSGMYKLNIIGGDWDVFVKISGRYELNHDFNYDRLVGTARREGKIVAKRYDHKTWDIATCYTFLYAIHESQVLDWIQNMVWICAITNRKNAGEILLLIEANLMCDEEKKFLYLFNEPLGVTARKWKNYQHEANERVNI